MALLTQTLVRFELQVEFAGLDTNNKVVERNKTFEIEAHGADDATKFANALTDVTGFLTDLAAMVECDISGHALRAVYDTSDALTAAQSNPYKEVIITLIPDTLGERDMTLRIPAPADSILANGETLINDDTAVLAFLDNFEPATTGYFRLSQGSSITAGAGQVRTSRVKSASSGKKYG